MVIIVLLLFASKSEVSPQKCPSSWREFAIRANLDIISMNTGLGIFFKNQIYMGIGITPPQNFSIPDIRIRCAVYHT